MPRAPDPRGARTPGPSTAPLHFCILHPLTPQQIKPRTHTRPHRTPAPSPTAAPSPIGKHSASSSLCAHLRNRTCPPRLPRHTEGNAAPALRSTQTDAAPKLGALEVWILTRTALRGCGCRGSQRCPPLLLRARCVIPGRLRSISAPGAKRRRSVLESLDKGAGN